MRAPATFRAWDKKTKQWICKGYAALGEVTLFNLVDQWLSEHKEGAKSMLERLGDVEETMFTGVNDKNGKEIYEGDIVNVDNSEPEENGEYDVITTCEWETAGFVLNDGAGGQWTRLLYHKPYRLTVIGNTYENPELLTPSPDKTETE